MIRWTIPLTLSCQFWHFFLTTTWSDSQDSRSHTTWYYIYVSGGSSLQISGVCMICLLLISLLPSGYSLSFWNRHRWKWYPHTTLPHGLLTWVHSYYRVWMRQDNNGACLHAGTKGLNRPSLCPFTTVQSYKYSRFRVFQFRLHIARCTHMIIALELLSLGN